MWTTEDQYSCTVMMEAAFSSDTSVDRTHLPSYDDCIYPDGECSSLLRNVDSSTMIDATGSSETLAPVHKYTLAQIGGM